MGPALFITGTDTGVGKTVVTAALARMFTRKGFNVGVMKPVETGVIKDHPSDAARLIHAAGVSDDLALVRPYAFRQPLAPWDAARAEQRQIRLVSMLRAYRALHARHDFVLIEGAGGVTVPLTATMDMRDLIEAMRVPVLVVGRVALGGVNHARLTVESLQARNISVAGVVLNRTVQALTPQARRQEQSTLRLIRETVGVPVIGPLPFFPHMERRFEQTLERLAVHPGMNRLMKLVAETMIRGM